MRIIDLTRETKETKIRLCLNLDDPAKITFKLGLPFFEHMLTAMAFHGGIGLEIQGSGDLEVDPHHLVEDVGLVLGQALSDAQEKFGPVARYGQSIIPMDDALSEAVIDVCRRPYLVYNAVFPQSHCGSFDVSLLREFFQALTNRAQINLHLDCRYGHNSHHMVEALFKALGRALWQAYRQTPAGTPVLSTKGAL